MTESGDSAPGAGSRSEGAPEVGLCAAKDCRKREEFGPLRDELLAECRILELPCLDVCKGPVAVLDPRSADAHAYARLRKPKLHRDLVARAAGGKETDRLAGVRVTGRRRDKILRRIRRALRRG